MALENLKKRIAENKDVTIGYFGGSITEGAGVEDVSLCWRSLTTQWLSERFPETNFKEINAAIGGTSSVFGLCRAKKHLLAYDPDVVFVEFAVNDSIIPAEESQACMEGIVRLILAHNPSCDIVFVYTATKRMHDDMKSQKSISSLVAHSMVAAHYGIESIDVGCTIIEKVEAGEGDWNTYTVDTVHPNAVGYRMYADKVAADIEKMLTSENGSKVFLAEPMSPDSFTDADMIEACELEGDFVSVEKDLCGRHPRYAEAKGNGEIMKAKVGGSLFALFEMIADDTGDVEVTIDGKNVGTVRTWDEYALRFSRGACNIITFKIDEGIHDIELKAVGTTDERSNGTYVRIACLLWAKRS